MIKEATKTPKYFGAVGRRKTAVAQVRITEGKPGFTINNRTLADYFPTDELRRTVEDAFEKTKLSANFNVSAIIRGGGIHSQAEALRHGIARSLLIFDVELRKKLKKAGYLKRDPRAKERRKFGLKKARKAPQWSKR